MVLRPDAGGVEEDVDSAEMEDGQPGRLADCRRVRYVEPKPERAWRRAVVDLARETFCAIGVEVRRDDVRARLREAERGRAADAAGGADDECDFAIKFVTRGFLDLAEFERPVFHFCLIGLGGELEALDRFGVGHHLHRRAIAVGGDERRAAVLAGVNDADAGDDDRLQEIGDRIVTVVFGVGGVLVAVSADGVPNSVNVLYVHTVSVHDQRPDARTEDVLRSHHASRRDFRELLAGDRLYRLGRVVEVKDAAPTTARQLTAYRRQDCRGDLASRAVVERRRSRDTERALTFRSLRHERLRLLDDRAQVLVALPGGHSPDREAMLLHYKRDRTGRRAVG